MNPRGYTKENVPVGTKFRSLADPEVIGVVTETWYDYGDGVTIEWSNGNKSNLYILEILNERA